MMRHCTTKPVDKDEDYCHRLVIMFMQQGGTVYQHHSTVVRVWTVPGKSSLRSFETEHLKPTSLWQHPAAAVVVPWCNVVEDIMHCTVLHCTATHYAACVQHHYHSAHDSYCIAHFNNNNTPELRGKTEGREGDTFVSSSSDVVVG